MAEAISNFDEICVSHNEAFKQNEKAIARLKLELEYVDVDHIKSWQAVIDLNQNFSNKTTFFCYTFDSWNSLSNLLEHLDYERDVINSFKEIYEFYNSGFLRKAIYLITNLFNLMFLSSFTEELNPDSSLNEDYLQDLNIAMINKMKEYQLDFMELTHQISALQ